MLYARQRHATKRKAATVFSTCMEGVKTYGIAARASLSMPSARSPLLKALEVLKIDSPSQSAMFYFFEPPEEKISTKPKKLKPYLVLLTASAPTRGKVVLAMIWICAVAVFKGPSVLIHLKSP